MVPFNIPPCVGTELNYLAEAIRKGKISGDGEFTRRCSAWMEAKFGAKKVLLTTSGTAALDMALLLCELRPGDEVLLPSYTFSSTANAVILAGGRPVFVDVRPDTMNLDETKLEAAVTERTRAVAVVHYAGVACEMDAVLDIARKHGLKVIEDAAQGVMAKYKGRYLGTVGDFGCYSFHETKNYSMGEGGALVINDPAYIERAEILREKGTNRSRFYRGEIDKYTWVDFGDSFLPSELNAAYLWAQLEKAEEINEDRKRSWKLYYEGLKPLEEAGKLELAAVPPECEPNGHIFYVKCADLEERTRFIAFLKERSISTVFHYVPLHSAPAGRKYGRFAGEDVYTTRDSERLVRLPMWYGLKPEDVQQVIAAVKAFYGA